MCNTDLADGVRVCNTDLAGGVKEALNGGLRC
jgi:hypothetical protein